MQDIRKEKYLVGDEESPKRDKPNYQTKSEKKEDSDFYEAHDSTDNEYTSDPYPDTNGNYTDDENLSDYYEDDSDSGEDSPKDLKPDLAEDLKTPVNLNSNHTKKSPDLETETHFSDKNIIENWIPTNCPRSVRKSNDRYSSSFFNNNTEGDLNEDTFPNPGEVEATKSSSVLVGEDVTLCWIETITIKEDKSLHPPKKLVLREFTISFENSATIPEKYLECGKLEGQVEPGCQNYKDKTGLFDVIDEDSKVSKLLNFTTISTKGDIEVRQHKNVRCAVGPVMTKNIIEFKDGSKNPKKRVEVKVSPRIRKGSETCPTNPEEGKVPTESGIKDLLNGDIESPKDQLDRLNKKPEEEPKVVNQFPEDEINVGSTLSPEFKNFATPAEEADKENGPTKPGPDDKYDDEPNVTIPEQGTYKDEITETGEDSSSTIYPAEDEIKNTTETVSDKESNLHSLGRESTPSSKDNLDNDELTADGESEGNNPGDDDTQDLEPEDKGSKSEESVANKPRVKISTSEEGPTEGDKDVTTTKTLTPDGRKKTPKVSKDYSLAGGPIRENEPRYKNGTEIKKNPTTAETLSPADEISFTTTEELKPIQEAEDDSVSCSEDDCSSCSGEECSLTEKSTTESPLSTKLSSVDEKRNQTKSDDYGNPEKEFTTKLPTPDEKNDKSLARKSSFYPTTARKSSNENEPLTDSEQENLHPDVEMPGLKKTTGHPTKGTQVSGLENTSLKPPKDKTDVPDILLESISQKSGNITPDNLILDGTRKGLSSTKTPQSCEDENCSESSEEDESSEDQSESDESVTESSEEILRFTVTSPRGPSFKDTTGYPKDTSELDENVKANLVSTIPSDVESSGPESIEQKKVGGKLPKEQEEKNESDESEETLESYSDEDSEELSSSSESSEETMASTPGRMPKNIIKDTDDKLENSSMGEVFRTSTEASPTEPTTSKCQPYDEECIYKSQTLKNESLPKKCLSSSSSNCFPESKDGRRDSKDIVKSKEGNNEPKGVEEETTDIPNPQKVENDKSISNPSIVENKTSPNTSSTGKHRLGLRIKILLEHINENDERKKLVEVEKHLLLNEDAKEHANNTIINQIKALNDSVTAQTIKALLNCTTLEKISNKGINVNVDEGTMLPKGKVGSKNLEPNELIVSLKDKSDAVELSESRRKREIDRNNDDDNSTQVTFTEAVYTDFNPTEDNFSEVTEVTFTEADSTEPNPTETHVTSPNYTKFNQNETGFPDENKYDLISNKNGSQIVKDCLPSLQEDINTGINHFISKFGNCRNIDCLQKLELQKPLPISEILGIISNPIDSRIFYRNKRDTDILNEGNNAFEKLDHWSNERFRRSARDQLRSLTEFTIFREA